MPADGNPRMSTTARDISGGFHNRERCNAKRRLLGTLGFFYVAQSVARHVRDTELNVRVSNFFVRCA